MSKKDAAQDMVQMVAEIRGAFGSFDLGLLADWISDNYVSKAEYDVVFRRNEELIKLNKDMMSELRQQLKGRV